MSAEYLTDALATFTVGFFPMAEIYVAVPTGMALGLDPVSAVAWAALGNYAPVLLIHWLYDLLLAVPRVGGWLGGLASEKVRARVEAGGAWFYLVMTPVIGTWALAVTVKVLRVPGRRFLLPSLVSVTASGALVAILIAVGISFRG